jgi:formylglycine-generating enzyme required for sulfatase activity
MSPAVVVKGKSVQSARYRRVIRTIVIAASLLPAFALAWNLDIVLRACRAFIDGKFTVQRFRYDLASLDLGRPASVTPVDQRASPVDGMVQVLIPAGEFTMGKRGEADVDSPPHPVFLDAFWMDRVEVSNAMYEKCVKHKGCTLPVISENHFYGNWIYREHPIVYVNWYQAEAYCEWAGRRLPTEAEWEKAARGTDERKYPWGNAKPNPYLANIRISLPAWSQPIWSLEHGGKRP